MQKTSQFLLFLYPNLTHNLMYGCKKVCCGRFIYTYGHIIISEMPKCTSAATNMRV